MKITQIKHWHWIAIQIAAILLCTVVISWAQPASVTPIPSGAQIVLWMRAGLVAQDPDLRATFLDNSAIGHFLGLLNLDLTQVDRVVLFAPFDKAWVNGTKLLVPQALPPNGALIVTGNFDAKTKYQDFKSKGWKEISYSNKKLLWWSTGTSYYSDPKSNTCVGQLPGGGFVVGGSQDALKGVLDVAGGKAQGLPVNATYDHLSQDFDRDNSKLASLFVLVTPEMRSIKKADTISIKSSTGRAAIGYIDYLDEAGLSAAKTSDGFLVMGYLGMDSETNSLIVSSIFQIGGGLGTFLPPNDLNRGLLENLSVSRQSKLVILQSNMTKQQLLTLTHHK